MMAPKTKMKAALTLTATVVIIPNVGLAHEKIIVIVPLEKIIAIVPAEARDLTVTTVLPDLQEESAHEAILHDRNRHGIAALTAAAAGGATIVTAVNVDVHDEVEAEATAAVCLPV